MAQAADMMKGAAMMMTMANVGLSVSLATSAYQMSGVTSASKEGDEAEMLNEYQESLDKTSESAMDSMRSAINNRSSTEAPVNAQKAATQLRSLAKDEKAPETIQTQAKDVADYGEKASQNIAFSQGGSKDPNESNNKPYPM